MHTQPGTRPADPARTTCQTRTLDASSLCGAWERGGSGRWSLARGHPARESDEARGEFKGRPFNGWPEKAGAASKTPDAAWLQVGADKRSPHVNQAAPGGAHWGWARLTTALVFSHHAEAAALSSPRIRHPWTPSAPPLPPGSRGTCSCPLARRNGAVIRVVPQSQFSAVEMNTRRFLSLPLGSFHGKWTQRGDRLWVP